MPTPADRPVVQIIFPRQEGRRSSGRDGFNGLSGFQMKSLPLYVLGGLVRRHGWEPVCVDEHVQRLPTERPDLVMLSVWTCLAPSAYELADRYREDGVPVVMGGVHPSLLPGEALRHADAVVTGEAEAVIGDLLADAEAGTLKPVYHGDWGDMTEVPHVSEYADLYAAASGLRSPIHGLQTSRGCKFNCGFCSVIRLNGRKMRHLTPERVVDELRVLSTLPPRLPGFTPVSLHDDDLFSDRDFTAAMFEEIIRSDLKISLSIPTSIGMGRDTELLELARRAGCKAVFIGLESVSRANLIEVNKKNRPREYSELIGAFHAHDIGVSASIILGFDGDEADVAHTTVDFLDEVGLDGARFTVLTPLPGTATFAQMYEEDRILDFNWAKYDVLHTVFQPARMTVQQLDDAVREAYRLNFTKPRLARRLRRMRHDLPLRTTAAYGLSGARYTGRIWEHREPAYDFTPDPEDLAQLLNTSNAPANEAIETAVAQVGGGVGPQPVALRVRSA